MDDAQQTSAGGMEVTPEEARFLRRFFLRQFLPWGAALLVISVTLSLDFGDDDRGALEARTSAAIAQLRAENQKIREELARTTATLGDDSRENDAANELERRVEDAKQNVRMIEARVTARLERRIDDLSAKIEQGGAPGPVGTAGPPPEAAAWDVSAILDRLYALEMAQDTAGQGGSGGASSSQLRVIEERLARLERAANTAGSQPASLAP